MEKDSHGHKKYGDFTPEEKVKHKERIWGYKLRREYGISSKDYFIMLDAQNGKCAICDKTTEEKLCVDHDHKTGKVRGLLCRNCNLKLQIYEDQKFMDRAEMYIKIHELRDKELLG